MTVTSPADLDRTADDPVEPGTDQLGPDLKDGAAGERPGGGSRLSRLARGRAGDPVWARPALLVLLIGTAVLYLWSLSDSGYANSFYSAAVQAGSTSWKAFFFGSSDSANFITVDKPPASLWVMDISVRIFGLNSWSVLAPQALEGVAAVGLLYATVRRWFTPGAALIAGAVLALTPVATLMFRFNNPDALLVLLLIGGAYATVRAVESGATKWLVLAGVLVGLGFITKMLQAFFVVPVFAATYLLAGPFGWWRRIRQLLWSGVALFLSAGWWVAVVTLWPKGSRPYIGGSQHNSILELIFGYNGFGRLTGNETGSVGGGGARAGGAGMWGATGIGRLFGDDMGTQVAWLIPAALVMLVAFAVITLRAVRTDRTRAAFVLWGGWLLVTGLLLSFAKGIIHPYYTVALAPAVGAVVGIGSAILWRGRDRFVARAVLAVALAVTAVWSAALLHRAPTWHPNLRLTVLVLGLAAAALLLVVNRLGRRIAFAVALAAIVGGIAAPAAYSLDTASTPHTGSIPSAGPAGQGGRGGFGGGGAFRGGAGGRLRGGTGNGFGGRAFPGFGGGGGLPGGGQVPTAPGGTAGGAPGGGFGGGAGGGAARGGIGGLLDAGTPSKALVTLLKNGASGYRWAAAAVGSNSAAGPQLASGEPIMAIGGFNGSDPSPTLAQFEALVHAHKIHYFLGGGGGFGGQRGGSDASGSISTWVTTHYTARTVGGQTVYDLSQPATAAAG